MRRKKIKKIRRSFIWKIFHNPFFIIFLLVLLPFLLWAVQQSQQYFTKAQSFNCPTTSTQSYNSIRPDTPPQRKIKNPESDPQINFSLHEWVEVNEAKELVNYGGETDPNPPPSIGSIFARKYPVIVKTYMIYHQKPQTEYDLCIAAGNPFCPKVTLIGLGATPGEPLLGLAAGRKIWGENTLMVLYADQNTITFTHSTGDTWPADGYPYYVYDICVDPNLLATYQKDNADGRGVLPGVRAGQIFGYAKNTDVKITVRDSDQWMDPRSKKDWWQFGPGEGTAYTPVSQPTSAPQPSAAPTTVNPSPVVPTLTSTITVAAGNFIVSTTAIPVQPTSQPKNPVLPVPTSIPPTATPTPAALIDIAKTVKTAKSVWSNLIVSIIRFTKAILP